MLLAPKWHKEIQKEHFWGDHEHCVIQKFNYVTSVQWIFHGDIIYVAVCTEKHVPTSLFNGAYSFLSLSVKLLCLYTIYHLSKRNWISLHTLSATTLQLLKVCKLCPLTYPLLNLSIMSERYGFTKYTCEVQFVFYMAVASQMIGKKIDSRNM